MALLCWPPADGPAHSRYRREDALASRAPDGWPSGWAGPGRQGAEAGLAVSTAGRKPVPVSGPLDTIPSGGSRYAVVPVSSRDAAVPVRALLDPADVLSTGFHASVPAGLEWTANSVQREAKPAPVPAQCAQTENTCWPLASRAVTRQLWVGICVHVCPPSWVAHSCGPKAQPSLRFRNRIWLTPVAPSGPWAGGAWMGRQVAPALSVRCKAMQAGAVARSHRPAGIVWPITQPVETPAKVTDSRGGVVVTRAGLEATGAAGGPEAGGLPGPAALAGRPVSMAGVASWGITTAATAATATAPAAARTARLARSLRACLLTRSNVPGGGSSGRTCTSSQVSSSSRGSGTVVPQRRPEPGPGLMQVRLDRALRPAEHGGHLPDTESRVVVEQERLPQPVGQRLDERAHIHVLRRVEHRVAVGGRAHRAQRAALPSRPPPVVAHQVGRDHVQVALRVVQRRPAGEQPGERLGRDLVCGVVIIHQPAHPPGEAGIARVEQLLGRGPVGGAELPHDITPGGGPRWSAPRSQQHGGAACGRNGGVSGLRLHRLYHTFCRAAGGRDAARRCPGTT